MDRLWVVQARFYGSKENWGVCSFISPLPFAATNYFEAHQLKRDIQEELFARCSWRVWNECIKDGKRKGWTCTVCGKKQEVL